MCAISLASSRRRCGLFERVTETISNSLSSYLILFRHTQTYIWKHFVFCAKNALRFRFFSVDLQRMIYRLVIRKVSTLLSARYSSVHISMLRFFCSHSFTSRIERCQRFCERVHYCLCSDCPVFAIYCWRIWWSFVVANAIRLHDWHCHQPLLISNVLWQVRWNA